MLRMRPPHRLMPMRAGTATTGLQQHMDHISRCGSFSLSYEDMLPETNLNRLISILLLLAAHELCSHGVDAMAYRNES
jgi:hypothetical protein